MGSLRVLFLLLLLANLLLFAYGQGHFGSYGAGGEPQRLLAQIAPERLVVHSRGDALPAAAACRRLDGLTPEQTLQLTELARERGGELALSQQAVEEPASWWVFLPPQSSRQAAEQRVAQLKRRALSDYFLIQETGPNQWAVSLGVFKSEPDAQERVATLQRAGVQDVQMAPREAGVPRVQLRVSGPARALEAFIAEARQRVPGLAPGSCPK